MLHTVSEADQCSLMLALEYTGPSVPISSRYHTICTKFCLVQEHQYVLNGDPNDVLLYKIECTSSMPNPVKDQKLPSSLHWQLTMRLLDEQFGPVYNIFKHIIFTFTP
jgi:hypothetical protein